MHTAFLQHSLATNGTPAPVKHTRSKHQTVVSAEAMHGIEDNSSGVSSSSNRALPQAASTYLPQQSGFTTIFPTQTQITCVALSAGPSQTHITPAASHHIPPLCCKQQKPGLSYHQLHTASLQHGLQPMEHLHQFYIIPL